MELEHGFTTRTEWENFFKIYFAQIRELEEFNSFQMDKEPRQWIRDFAEKSQELERKYRENNAYLMRHVYYFTREHHPWEKAVADPLLSFLYRYSTRFEDIEAAYELAQSLFAFYDSRNDPVALMKCDMIMLTVYFFLDTVHLKGRISERCTHAIGIFEQFYDQLNEEEKSMGMSFYDYQAVFSSEYLNEAPLVSTGRLFDEYENRMKMLKRFRAEADMDLPLNQALPYFENCWTSNFLRLSINANMDLRRYFTTEQLAYQLTIATRLLDSNSFEEHPTTHIKYRIICLMLNYYLGNLDADTVHSDIMECEAKLDHKRMTVWEEYDDETTDCFNLVLKSLMNLEQDSPGCVADIRKVFWHLLDVYTHFPSNNYLESVANGFIYLYLIPALKYLDDDETMSALLRLTVYRQPQTLFHSVIVSRCARLVMQTLIHRRPETLIGILSCTSVADVQKKEAELTAFAENSARLHDIGKILCTNVINMQYRKLTDIEFEVIKYHPVTGLHILQQIPSLTPYAGIAAGHHKFCDGSFGYPSDFDHRSAPARIVTDIVSICDSLDAATDYLGRSYAKTKSFPEILKELQDGSGRRYSKEIVSLITDSLPLQHDLERFLLHDREQICLELYIKMKGITK